MSTWSNGRRALLLLALGGVRLAAGFEQMAPISVVTASKYDTRSGLAIDEFKGCFEDGCKPELLIDDILNDVKQSRWSCETELVGSIEECYVTFDLGEALTLSKIVLYFRESNDTERSVVNFIVSTSLTDVTYTESFTSVNTPGTELMVGEEFEFPLLPTGRYVRFEGILEEDEWMSVNEAEIYVDSDTLLPTNSPTSAGVTTPPTAGPTFFGGEDCLSVTLSGAGELDGEFMTTVTASASSSGEVAFVSAADNSTVMSHAETNATCTDDATNCKTTMWKISTNNVASFIVYDEAIHPSLINELWISIYNCVADTCNGSPADLSIVCGDGSSSLAPTPSPVVTDSSVCGVVEVSGTSLAAIDGLYYDDGTGATTGISQYSGYDADGTSNNNTILSRDVNGTCSSSSSSAAISVAASAASSDCVFRQWWVEAQTSSSSATDKAFSYFTYDEADHPADMLDEGLWYTSTDQVLPYDGEVTITCAPAETPTLSPAVTGFSPVETPSPSETGRGAPSITRGPVTASPFSTGEIDTVTKSTESGSSGGTGVIVGGVVGGVALLAILGAVAYKMKKATPPPPPPSYDDLVGA